MNTLKTVFKIIIMIAVSLTTLSGCGGGSGADTAPVTGTVNITPPVQTTATVPAAPTGVTAAGCTNKTTLSWSAVSGATSYTIYWSKATVATATTGTKIATAGTSYIHRGLFPAATYNYVVTAQNNSGESIASGQVSAVTAMVDGATPYTTYCSGCHGDLAFSIVTNASVTDVKAAMQNFNAMSSLGVTDDQIKAISAALMFNQ